MALFHFHAAQVKRSAGQSAIACAAYRAGERLYSEYYGDFSDYTRKGGVICSEILLPSHAPPEYADRQTLWNAVEKAERGKNAQLAYSFDIALQNEFSLEENIALARQFLLENFVSRGMIADFAVHQPDKEGGIQNPHFHVLCPIRPLKENGEWDAKQHRVYVLDEHGNRISDGDGNFIFNAVPTTDWGKPETLEAWREEWAGLCNAKFAEKGLDCRIDNRSFVRRGVEQLPTVHEGPAVRQMEARGIPTNKGSLNQWIRTTNQLIQAAKKRIADLLNWLKDAKEELSQPQRPSLAALLGNYYVGRNAAAWSDKAKTANLKKYAEDFEFLKSRGLFTADDLESYMNTLDGKLDKQKSAAKAASARMKELDDLLRMAEYYAAGKPFADELDGIRFKGRREKYKAEHENELRLYYMSHRKLEPFMSDGKFPITQWRKELESKKQEYVAEQTESRPLYADVKRLWEIRSHINQALEQERKADKTHQKTREQEV
jgi:hypothetical protein